MVTQEFGPTIYETFHTGIDIAYYHPVCGGKIYAAADGVVLADGRPKAEWGDTAIGVIIGHSQRLQTWYWHLASEIVSVGQEVHAGDLIGYEGSTGWASGCHLHFQVMFDDKPVNPASTCPELARGPTWDHVRRLSSFDPWHGPCYRSARCIQPCSGGAIAS